MLRPLDNLYTETSNLLGEYGLTMKGLVKTVTDSGSNMVKAFSVYDPGRIYYCIGCRVLVEECFSRGGARARLLRQGGLRQ